MTGYVMSDASRQLLALYLMVLGVTDEKAWAATYTIEKLLPNMLEVVASDV